MNTMHHRRGFSLLELTLVLVIIGLMTAAAAVFVFGQGERAKRDLTWSSMNTIRQAIEQYNLNNSQYPPTLVSLQQGTFAYLDPHKPLKDGWKRDFLYSPNGTAGRPYDLFSKGADGQFPSADDLDIWKPPTD